MSEIIRNKKAYDSGDVTVVINGVLLNVIEISYDVEQEHQLNHTLGNKASSWSQGKIKPSASMSLMMEDATTIESGVGGDLLGIKPFEVNVTFANEFNVLVNDTITAKFQKQGREVKGDMGLQFQYDLFCLGIEFNNI
jgi:hypothetical protein